jgi:hypothetical protein
MTNGRAFMVLFGLVTFILAVGYDARGIARCGVSLCTIGIIINKEFRLW